MRSGVVIALVVIGIAATACPGLLGSARISEGQANKIKDRNAEVAASLPVFPDSRLKVERQTKCEGAFQHEDTTACPLSLTYETTSPLVEILAFYESHLTSIGWTPLDIGLVRTRFFESDGVIIQVYVRVPLQTCPDAHFELEAARACEEEWVRSEGGDYIVKISPD